MNTPDDVKKLEMRLDRIEDLLKGLRPQRPMENITVDELKAYQKIRDLVAIDPACGINECSRCTVLRCVRCIVDRCIVRCLRCDVECICGPCNMGDLGIGGAERFGGLGG